MIKWLNEYSELNEDELIQKGKRDTNEAQMQPLISLEERRKALESDGVSSSSDEE